MWVGTVEWLWITLLCCRICKMDTIEARMTELAKELTILRADNVSKAAGITNLKIAVPWGSWWTSPSILMPDLRWLWRF